MPRSLSPCLLLLRPQECTRFLHGLDLSHRSAQQRKTGPSGSTYQVAAFKARERQEPSSRCPSHVRRSDGGVPAPEILHAFEQIRTPSASCSLRPHLSTPVRLARALGMGPRCPKRTFSSGAGVASHATRHQRGARGHARCSGSRMGSCKVNVRRCVYSERAVTVPSHRLSRLSC